MAGPTLSELSGKTAVITGAASGFGREFALLCAAEKMKLVLADLDEKGLAATDELVRPFGVETLLRRCDVSKAEDVEALAAATYERFGAAHLVFNNAGVAVSGPSWSATLEDWQWVMGVNVMGVVHGIRSFVPRMLEQKTPGYVVNTASVAGLLAVPGSSVYSVSKHSVVVLSECLYQELQMVKAPIGVSVLCPAFVNTGIKDSGRNRPKELAATNPLAAPFEAQARKAVESGRIGADQIARMTLDAVKEGRFYVITHPRIKGAIETRMQDILGERQPTNTMPPA